MYLFSLFIFLIIKEYIKVYSVFTTALTISSTNTTNTLIT
jgi:hypothetical protein